MDGGLVSGVASSILSLWLEGSYVWVWYYYPFGGWGYTPLVGGYLCVGVVLLSLWLVGLWVGGCLFGGWGDSYRPLRLEGVCGVWYPLAGGFVRVGNAPLVGGGIPL